ncbi:hypothetical protein C7D72_29145, partial [Klebsiella pneumoniae]
ILVTGPTGSGKSTTLYAALSRLDARERNIMTIERVVLRLLDKNSVNLDLLTLGMPPALRRVGDALIARPHGIILVTGPTGSGKSTTLYAALSRLDARERNIMTIE